MKTLTQIVLPLAALAALVFGITYVLSYTSNPPPTDSNVTAVKTVLNFWETSASGARSSESKQDQSAAPTGYVKYWRDEYELGEEGHFDFWFRNEHKEPVRLGFLKANCQCASLKIILIPPEVWAEYARSAAVAGPTPAGNSPKPSTEKPVPSSQSASGIPGAAHSAAISIVPHPVLEDKLHFPGLPAVLTNEKINRSTREWNPLKRNEDFTIPGATDAGWQVGIVRLGWTGKDHEGGKNVNAELGMQLPGAPASVVTLQVDFKVIPPFNIYAPSSARSGGKTVMLADLMPGKSVSEYFFVWSGTRPELPFNLSASSLGDKRECVNWSETSATEAELKMLPKLVFGPVGGQVLCARKVTITVNENKEVERNGVKSVKRLDIGPFSFFMSVDGGEGKPLNVPIKGIVRGEIHLSEGKDWIDFGTTFPSSQGSRSRSYTLVSDRKDFDIELASGESTPEYLEVGLKPKADSREDAREWTLEVKVPKNKLFGDLLDSYVVLKVKDGTSRRIRIPVIAKAYDDNSGQ